MSLLVLLSAAFSAGAETGGGHYERLVAGNVSHADECQYGRAYGEDARNGEQRVLSQFGCPLEEIYGQDNLVAYQDDGVEVAQADLSDAVLVQEYYGDAENSADDLEYGGQGESLGHGDRYEWDGGGGITHEANHRSEEHGYQQPCRYGQKQCLYSLYHIVSVCPEAKVRKIVVID